MSIFDDCEHGLSAFDCDICTRPVGPLTDPKTPENEKIAKLIVERIIGKSIDEHPATFGAIIDALDAKDATIAEYEKYMNDCPNCKRILELEAALKTAHELFGSESDKLGKIINELETQLASALEALGLKKDGEDAE